MQKFIRCSSISLAVLLVAQQQPAFTQQPLPVPAPRMEVAVVEGEAAIHNVRARKPINIAVLVRDGNRKPIPGVPVTFTLPESGPGATFGNTEKTITVISDKDGYAVARDLRPNTTAGPYRIEVQAKRGNETATASVTQFNMIVASKRGGSGKWVVILVAVGGAAAAGGVVAATHGSSSPSAVVSAPIGITPGGGTVGPPR